MKIGAPIRTVPLVGPLPLAVGVYYAPDLRDHECAAGKNYFFERFLVRLGPPSIQLFDLLTASLFARTTSAIGRPSAAEPTLRDVIEIGLAGFSGCEARWPIFDMTTVHLAYRVVVWDPNGLQLAAWVPAGVSTPAEIGSGAVPRPPMSQSPESFQLAELTSITMRKAAADFVRGFHDRADVRTWLESRGARVESSRSRGRLAPE